MEQRVAYETRNSLGRKWARDQLWDCVGQHELEVCAIMCGAARMRKAQFVSNCSPATASLAFALTAAERPDHEMKCNPA